MYNRLTDQRAVQFAEINILFGSLYTLRSDTQRTTAGLSRDCTRTGPFIGFYVLVFTARRYAERGIDTESRPSDRLSVRL